MNFNINPQIDFFKSETQQKVRPNKALLEGSPLSSYKKNLPLKVLSVLINEQKFTKTANCWGVSNNKKGTNSNRIVLLEKIKCYHQNQRQHLL